MRKIIAALKGFFRFNKGNRSEKKAKRGITIAECAVALTVITIVSISAISVIKHGLDYANKAEYADNARRDAANALECFKFADDEETFYRNLPYKNLEIKEYAGGVRSYEYRYGILYSCIIKANYKAEGGDYFKAICTDKSGRTVFEFEYRKG